MAEVPSNVTCKCDCPEYCEHKWDGPGIEFDEGRGWSSSCSKCRISAMDHDIWTGP